MSSEFKELFLALYRGEDVVGIMADYVEEHPEYLKDLGYRLLYVTEDVQEYQRDYTEAWEENASPGEMKFLRKQLLDAVEAYLCVEAAVLELESRR